MRDVLGVVGILGAMTVVAVFLVFLGMALFADDWAQATFWLLCVCIVCRLLVGRSV